MHRYLHWVEAWTLEGLRGQVKQKHCRNLSISYCHPEMIYLVEPGRGRRRFQTNSPLNPFYITAKIRLSDLLSGCMQVLASFRNSCVNVDCSFCTILSFTIFQLVPVEEKPESSSGTFFFFCYFQGKSNILLPSQAFIFCSTQQPFIAQIGRLPPDLQLCSFYKI